MNYLRSFLIIFVCLMSTAVMQAMDIAESSSCDEGEERLQSPPPRAYDQRQRIIEEVCLGKSIGLAGVIIEPEVREFLARHQQAYDAYKHARDAHKDLIENRGGQQTDSLQAFAYLEEKSHAFGACFLSRKGFFLL